MSTLVEMSFHSLQAGMKFKHAKHGEQIIMDLGQGLFGPAIHFHNSDMYSGQMPTIGEEEGDVDIFQAIAQSTYPYGAEEWKYIGTASPEEVAAHGWQWWQVACPHCGFVHHILASAPPSEQRRCRDCGMVFNRPADPLLTPPQAQ